MEKEFKVNCPCCDLILVIDKASGKIVETRKPLVKESTGDRFKDAFLKREQDKERLAGAFDNIKEEQEKKKRAASELFNASLDSARNDNTEKPHSIFDQD
ncbi:hypothetical protein MNBD_NITROSPINAE02-1058 [hydrothermal vent metagenome]|uniref:2-nitropropane dioxygenase n=1 Tax=hydrothermal vent metagenome TaxID=652676 RepID=A0A3B1CHQ2_9ZZZZ